MEFWGIPVLCLAACWDERSVGKVMMRLVGSGEDFWLVVKWKGLNSSRHSVLSMKLPRHKQRWNHQGGIQKMTQNSERGESSTDKLLIGFHGLNSFSSSLIAFYISFPHLAIIFFGFKSIETSESVGALVTFKHRRIFNFVKCQLGTKRNLLKFIWSCWRAGGGLRSSHENLWIFRARGGGELIPEFRTKALKTFLISPLRTKSYSTKKKASQEVSMQIEVSWQ